MNLWVAKMGVNERRQGFTLLELMIVFTILGLFATIAMTSLASRVGDYRFTQAMEIIGRVDAYARRQASTQRQTVRTSVASLTNVLRVGSPEDPTTRSFKLPTGIRIGQTKFRKQTIPTTDFDIRYNPYGISPTYAMKLTQGSQSRWIIVLGSSGQIIQTNEAGEVDEILSL
ncbi:MAG: type II secretion system protein [Planctomycetaceae bacterium]|nr:type II secretion system protein [Planctomycetaceae bacterium]